MATVLVASDGTGDVLSLDAAGLSGNEAGTVVKIKRGTVLRGQAAISAYGAVGNPLRFTCYGDSSLPLPIISGRRVVTETWVADGSDWYISIATSEQVFTSAMTDLRAVATRGEMVAGTQYYDYANQLLYIRLADGSDPNDATLEISNNDYSLDITAAGDGVEVDNIEFHSGHAGNLYLHSPAGAPRNGWKVQYCNVYGGGVSANGGHNDAVLIAGTDALSRITGLHVRGNRIHGCYNNALELNYAESALIEHNRITHCGGGIELWQDSTGHTIRYNRAANINGDLCLNSPKMGALVWIANNAGTSDNNTIYGNIAVNCEHGIKLWKGTGHIVLRNTLWGIRELGLSRATAGTAITDFSENIIAMSAAIFTASSTPRFVDDAVADANIDGDRNIYVSLHANDYAMDGRWRIAAGSATVDFSTHQANCATADAVTPLDANSTYVGNEADVVSSPVSEIITSLTQLFADESVPDPDDYAPVAAGAAYAGGVSTTYPKDLRGEINHLDIGAVQTKRLADSAINAR